MNIKQFNVAIIDDDKEWIDIIKKIVEDEFDNCKIKTFEDFILFVKNENVKYYDVIICDFYFKGYDLNSIEKKKIKSILGDYQGSFLVITGMPSSVKNELNLFSRIINKSHLMKSNFKFSRFL